MNNRGKIISLLDSVSDQTQSIILENIQTLIVKEGSSRIMVDRAFEWAQTATQEDFDLQNKIYTFGHFFEDMLFSNGTETNKLIQCKMKMDGNWIDSELSLPDQIEYFSYDCFTYHVKDLDDGILGQFDPFSFSITVSHDHLNDDGAVLHEMIHLHEFVIDSLPLFFHDAILWCLYRKLTKLIPDLDERIEAHGHILNSSTIARQGGTHDILFLLKSFDLDFQMGYKLGTVFGYGMVNQGENIEER